MSDENEFIDDEMEFNKDTDVPPDEPIPAGFYEGVVSGVRRENPNEERPDSLFPKCIIARVKYRLNHEDPTLNGKYFDDFPMPMKGDPQSWKWFKWCETMGYDTSSGFKFSPKDVEGVAVSLKFGPPRAGKGKNEGKLYSNLEAVKRLA